MELENPNPIKAQSFKFERMWTTRKDFENLVKQAWGVESQGSHMFNLVKKTFSLKIATKKWNKTTFGNIFNQIKENEMELLEIQKEIISNTNQTLINKQNRLINKKECLLSFHKKYWSQRAKTKHIKSIDTNTNYFHRDAMEKEAVKSYGRLELKKERSLLVLKTLEMKSAQISN